MSKKNKKQSEPERDSKAEKIATEATRDDKKSVFRELGEILFYGLSLLIFFKTFVWQNFQIPTQSMENTLLIGDHITTNTFMFKSKASWEKSIFPFRELSRGDVVVFKWPGDTRQDWIKRCIGVPGDAFKIINDRVYINDEPLEETYTYYKNPAQANNPVDTGRDPENKYRPMGYDELQPGLDSATFRHHQEVNLSVLKNQTLMMLREFKYIDQEEHDRLVARLKSAPDNIIPEGYYLVMGDNRNRSADSRVWGLLPIELVHGRAYFVWWSYGEDENAHEKKGAALVGKYVRLVYTFFTRTRWEESFRRIK